MGNSAISSAVTNLLYTQENRLIKIHVPADNPKKTALGGDLLLLRSFSGHEGVSRLFQYDLVMHSIDNKIDFNAMIGQSATIEIVLPDNAGSRYINGAFSSFSQGGSSPLEAGLLPTHFTEYRATLVPWLWMLTRESDCRIFQNESLLEILDDIFLKDEYKKIGRNWDYRYSGHDEKREYCVQYRETDFNFVSRLMEEEGIFYFFEHTPTSHTLVLANEPSKFLPVPGLPAISFREERVANVITEWNIGQEVRPGAYTLRDFNFEQPKLDLTAMEFGLDDRGFEIYDYPGEYKTIDQGSEIAGTRVEEEETPTVVASGVSTCRDLLAGYRFQLKDHYRDDLNKEYMLTAVYQQSDQGDNYRSDPGGAQKAFSYLCRFQCIPYPTPFRPPRVTPEPVMRGSQTAIVVGQQGEEIWPDPYGRVKVWFHWDREEKRHGQDIPPEERSCWIRVSEGWAGSGWGAMHLPRVGQEVIVDFLEGDPDRPIITGRVYNADNMPPWKLPDEKTKSGWKSHSSKNGSASNYNEIRFEDKKGHEDLLIHAERTMHNSVEASQFITVGGDRHITTGGVDKNGNNVGDVKELVYGNHNLHVKGENRVNIEKDSSLDVGGSHYAMYTGDVMQYTGSGKYVILADTIQLQGTKKIVLMAGASSVVIDASGVTVLGSPLINLNSPGAPPTPEMPPVIVEPDDP
jgi:type VI secretion system secreted protein VgrG